MGLDLISSTSNSEPTSKEKDVLSSRNQDQEMIVQSSSIFGIVAMTSMCKPHDAIGFISDLAKLNLYHVACVTYCLLIASLCNGMYGLHLCHTKRSLFNAV